MESQWRPIVCFKETYGENQLAAVRGMKMTISPKHMNLARVPPSEALAPRVICTQRQYCLTAKCWWQEATMAPTLSRARKCMILSPVRGPRPVALESHARATQRQYCLT